MSAIGLAIRGAREAGGLTRAEVAGRAGISTVTVSKIEQGARRPSPSVLTRVAEALNVTAGELTLRAALLDVSGATTDEEMRRRLLQAAAISASVRAVLPPLLGLGALASL